MPVAVRLPLQVFFEREARHPRKPFLVQPVDAGEVQTLTWGEVGHQARCAAQWLRARALPPGSHIALISKNCAHWIIADLAIWMAGHVSVPLYPNLTADSVAHVLTHSEAALVFIGKLDDWPAMARHGPRCAGGRADRQPAVVPGRPVRFQLGRPASLPATPGWSAARRFGPCPPHLYLRHHRLAQRCDAQLWRPGLCGNAGH